MKKNIISSSIAMAAFLTPLISYAQGVNCSSKYNLKCLVGDIIEYLELGIYLIIALAIVTFVWNVYRYFFTEKEKKEAGLYVLYSTIGFFVILSLWGLVALLTNSFRLNNQTPSSLFGGSTNTGVLGSPTQTGGGVFGSPTQTGR